MGVGWGERKVVVQWSASRTAPLSTQQSERRLSTRHDSSTDTATRAVCVCARGLGPRGGGGGVNCN